MVYYTDQGEPWNEHNPTEALVFLHGFDGASSLQSAQRENAEYAALSFVRGDLCFDLSPYIKRLTVGSYSHDLGQGFSVHKP
ncbi:hypothetical protein VB775_15545 [Pseudanabaena sp. CCNP1317]|jgi:hypothetical protein|nr:hypothetical protein [Pseudanabaena sp. CCNP1317]MEA5488236.1 hypothetical protein [Pseudanabaena sp. CCNP1317]